MDRIIVNQPIIVEGKYDKIKLDAFIDGVILCSDGFRIFKNKEKLALIRRLATDKGVILLTDSDVAGFKLRSFIKQALKGINVISIYIPQIRGKEKRKLASSKEGLLGVEGMSVSLLRELFAQAGVLNDEPLPVIDPILRADLYQDGLIGKENSTVMRQALLTELNLPTYITTNALLDIINRVMTRAQYTEFISSYIQHITE